MSRSIIRADLAEAVRQEIGFSRSESDAIVGTILEEIALALEKGETVKISSFGSFVTLNKAQRTGRNPKTGIEVPITPRRVASFRPSSKLRKRVNNGGASPARGE